MQDKQSVAFDFCMDCGTGIVRFGYIWRPVQTIRDELIDTETKPRKVCFGCLCKRLKLVPREERSFAVMEGC